MKKDLKQNLSTEQINCIKFYKKHKPFLISYCDKNVGWALISKDLYLEIVNDHLFSNLNTYRLLDTNPLEDTKFKINNELETLNKNGHISNRLFNKLKLKHNNKYNLGKFYILFKLHKSDFGIRPIINCLDHPLVGLCLFIDLILQFFVKKTESYIKDSQNLLQILENLKIDSINNYHLYSADFSSLYTEIDSNDAIFEITQFLSNNFKSDHIDNFGLNCILKLIFFNNVFTFNSLFLLQINGLSMGCKCGPSVSNLYVYTLEIKWLTLNKPTVYNRFIDDIFMCNKTAIDTFDLCNQFKNLRLNIVSGNKVQFLDLYIELNKFLDCIDTTLYTKPTNTFQYLYYTSNHPSHIFKNIPKSLFIRLRRICTRYCDYLYYSRQLIFQLVKRGYIFKKLLKICITIGNIDRSELLPYKSKTNNNFSNKLKLILYFDFNFINLKPKFFEDFKFLISKYKLIDKYSLLPINKMLPNLKLILINNNNINFFSKNFFTTECNTLNCKHCNFVLKTNCIKYNNFHWPLICNCNCQGLFVIYILKCIRCNCFYIGQAQSFEKRFKQHKRDITSFKPYLNVTSEVGLHFNLKNHDYKKDLKFCIFNKDLKNLEDRLSIETDMINIFRINGVPLLNIKIPNHNFINRLSHI
jgi:predicted GIY-YIG superfamily endonuclease